MSGNNVLAFPLRPGPPLDDEATMVVLARRARERHPDLPELECIRRANFAMAEARGGMQLDIALKEADVAAALVDGPEDAPAGVALVVAGRLSPRPVFEAPEAPPCAQCEGDGDAPSGEVDEDGDECPPILCPACGGTGKAPLSLAEASSARPVGDPEGRPMTKGRTRGRPRPAPAPERPRERPTPPPSPLDAQVLAELPRRVCAQAYDLAGEGGPPDGPAEITEALARLLKRGLVEKYGRGRMVLWKVVRPALAKGGLS